MGEAPTGTGSNVWPLVALGVLTFLQTAPLAFRRRRPILVLTIVVIASVILSFINRTPIEAFALFIALYSSRFSHGSADRHQGRPGRADRPGGAAPR